MPQYQDMETSAYTYLSEAEQVALHQASMQWVSHHRTQSRMRSLAFFVVVGIILCACLYLFQLPTGFES